MVTPTSAWWAPSSKPPRYLVDMHLARRGYLLTVLMALLGITGTWSDDPSLEGAPNGCWA